MVPKGVRGKPGITALIILLSVIGGIFTEKGCDLISCLIKLGGLLGSTFSWCSIKI